MSTVGGRMKGLRQPYKIAHRKTRNAFLEAIRRGRPIPIIGPWPVPDNHPLPYMGIEGKPEALPPTQKIEDPMHSEEHRGEGLSEEELPTVHSAQDTKMTQRPRTTFDTDEMSFQGES